jgi:hypothetical protein
LGERHSQRPVEIDEHKTGDARATQLQIEQTYRWPRVPEETWMAYDVD